MRDVAVVAFAETPHVATENSHNEVEMVMPVTRDVLDRTGLDSQSVGFVVSGSNDYLAGMPFSFVAALDAVGAWPPIEESHVEMDGAWALYEAWVRLQHGDIDTALVYAFGKSSMTDIGRLAAIQMEPYTVAPLWPEANHMAALQARACLEAGTVTREQMDQVASRSRRDALANPAATIAHDKSPADLATEPIVADPLRRSDCAPISDGAAAIVLAVGDVARSMCDRPAWIRGIDHRIESHALGTRTLTRSTSTAIAAEALGVTAKPVDLAEIHAPYSHQETLLVDALGLTNSDTVINPSGGALAANPPMVAGLIRIGEAAERLSTGAGKRAVAHATSGPCLQQNLVTVLEVD